jgi:LacI family transcriptional regulator
MNKRITIRDIALKAGVHHTTVSRALKNDSRISKESTARILALAKQMDYRPDPMLTSLVAYRSLKHQSEYQATLGWITNYPTKDGWKTSEKIGYFAGAKQRTKELGYRLDEFWLHEKGMTSRRAAEILDTRNIQGLIFIPQPRARAHIRLVWEKFSAISISHTLTWPPLHTVTNHHFRSMLSLMRHLKRLGYKRPGFACKSSINESVDRDWGGAFLAYYPENTPLIPLFINSKWTQDAFRIWLKKHKPDVVISHDKKIVQWIEESGLRIPEDIGFALPAQHDHTSTFSGIDENNELVGKTAVNLVVDMIHRGETGIPEVPLAILVAGSWLEGSTLRRQTV